ncbi:MAG: TetR family transcriptional regulator [Rhodospirillaceae bacterium]|nr:TetR family transcriptional regulator [Rhodospirillaceae bacterium]
MPTAPSAARRGRARARRPAASDSEKRILDAAEGLFAALGYNGVSIRDIAAAARANISSVYYHFGSKQRLLEAVCRRRMAPAVEARALALAEAMAAGGAVDAGAVIDGFVGPTLRAALGPARQARIFRQLAGHLATDPTPEVRRVVRGIYEDSVKLFVDALRRAYPGLAGEAFFWGAIASLGTSIYVQSDFSHLARLIGGGEGRHDEAEAIRQVGRFVAGGLDALAATPGAKAGPDTKKAPRAKAGARGL